MKICHEKSPFSYGFSYFLWFSYDFPMFKDTALGTGTPRPAGPGVAGGSLFGGSGRLAKNLFDDDDDDMVKQDGIRRDSGSRTLGKTIGTPWENQGKTIGKWWFNGGLMEVEWWLNGIQWDFFPHLPGEGY